MVSGAESAAGVFSQRRAWLAILVSVAIMAVAAWVVRAYPNPGYRAGYDAVAARGEEWITVRADVAGGSVSTVCEELRRDVEQSELQPRYDHATFIQGCRDAIEQVVGRPFS